MSADVSFSRDFKASERTLRTQVRSDCSEAFLIIKISKSAYGN